MFEASRRGKYEPAIVDHGVVDHGVSDDAVGAWRLRSAAWNEAL